MQVRLLTTEDVQRCIDMSRAIELMRLAFRAISADDTIKIPARTSLGNTGGTLLYKPAYMDSAGIFCVKVASVFLGNAAMKLPVTTGLLLVNDANTGLPLAVMDAEFLTSLRTGAASGLATQLLARPDVKTAALIGVGGQAACQLEAILDALPLETVYVYARRRENAERFCEEMKTTACRLVASSDRSVLKQCGVICTATSSHRPVFSDDEISPGTHINGIGSFRPDMAEIPIETIKRAFVCVDERETCLAEAGDFRQGIEIGQLPADFSAPELGEVLSGAATGRSSQNQITIFKSIGNAAQDIVCAAEILKAAQANNIGRMFAF